MKRRNVSELPFLQCSIFGIQFVNFDITKIDFWSLFCAFPSSTFSSLAYPGPGENTAIVVVRKKALNAGGDIHPWLKSL